MCVHLPPPPPHSSRAPMWGCTSAIKLLPNADIVGYRCLQLTGDGISGRGALSPNLSLCRPRTLLPYLSPGPLQTTETLR